MSRVSPQLIVFSYHKTGTSLFLFIMTKLCERLGLRLANHYGMVDHLDGEPDVVLLPHSLLRAAPDHPYRAIRLVRDPRDIWVSGYLYHRRCEELWCVNTDLAPTPPIGWPKVDYSVQHWPEAWKRRYLERLGRKSYQRNLLDRSLADGLDFELEGYTGCTLTAMRAWKQNHTEAMDVALEDVMANFDNVMLRIFSHFEFTADQCAAALEVARSEDIRRMDDEAIRRRPHIHSRQISKWRDVLSPAQIARFNRHHGDLIQALGYASDTDTPDGQQSGDHVAPPRPPALPAAGADEATPTFARCVPPAEDGASRTAVVVALHDAEVRLSADGAMIRSTVVTRGIYSFVVPAGKRRIRLESLSEMAVDPHAPDFNRIRRLGVKVSRIEIRCDTWETVIVADDPSLTGGWHDAEHAGASLWRWTAGSADIPWTGIVGRALVSVRCETLPSYPSADENPVAEAA